MNKTNFQILITTTQWLGMIMKTIQRPFGLPKRTSQTVATTCVLLGFSLSALAVEPVVPERLDCLLEPYEVVEVSSAVEGVIENIYVDRNDVVKRGQLLVELDSDVEKTQVNLAKTRAGMSTNIELRATELAFYQRNLDRLQELYDSDTISLHVKDEAETDTSKSRLQLRNAEDSQTLARLELAKAEAILSLRAMRSPIDGVVVARNKVAGEFVEDQSILRLAQLNPLKVEVIVPVEMFGTIEKGMQVEVMPENYGEESYKATVTMVDKVIDPASGTFDVRAELPNPDHIIPSGLRCTVQFLPKPPESTSIASNAPVEVVADAEAEVALEVAEVEVAEVEVAEVEVAEVEVAQVEVAEVEVAEVEVAEVEVAEVEVAEVDVAEVDVAEVAVAEVEVAEVEVAEVVNDAPRLQKVAMLHAAEECTASRKTRLYSYKVLADPYDNFMGTRSLVKQLKEQGVDDLYVVASGENRGQVALGLYHEKPYAEERLDEIFDLGFQVHMDIRSEVKIVPDCASGQMFADSER
jgi:RND family efflux transporter MFP subunit